MGDELDAILADLEDPIKDPDKDLDMDSDDVKKLKEELEAKEKKIAGLLNETKAQRKKRQETEQRLNTLTDTVNKVLASRQTAVPATQTPQQKMDAILKGDYDDDGNPIINAESVKGLVAPEVKTLQDRIANLEAMLQATTQAQQSESEGTKIINAIVGSDERFGPAYQKYQTARKWVEDKVIEFQRENNIEGIISPGQALDYIFDDESEDEFKSLFPDMDLETIVTAEESQRHLRKTLDIIADAMSPKGNDNEKGNRINKLLQKPSGLGKSANAKGAELSIIDKLQNFKTDDLLNISDEQEKAILKALAKESE